MAKIMIWMYALFGSGVWMTSRIDDGTINRFAHAPLLLLIWLAPVALTLLVTWPLVQRILAEESQ